MTDLLQNGQLLYGAEIRNQLALPGYADYYADAKRHYEGIRQYTQTLLSYWRFRRSAV